MKKLLASVSVAAMCFAPLPANAWLAQVPVSAPSYTGMVDVVGSPVDYWGFRAATAALAASGVAMFQVCTAGDAVCTDIHATSTGGPSASDLTTSGCAAINTCTIKNMYGQINNHTCAETLIAQRPLFYPNGEATGKPAAFMQTPGPNDFTCSGIPTTNAPWTMVLTINPEANPGANNRLWVSTDPDGILYASGSPGTFSVYGGGFGNAGSSSALGAFYSVIGTTSAGGSSGTMSVNGATTSSLSNGTDALSTPAYVAGTGEYQTGYWVEWAMYSGQFNSTQITNVTSNVRTYGGF